MVCQPLFLPAQAMLTTLFRKHFPRGPEAMYLGDHALTSCIACEGTIAFEAYNVAIIREHPDCATRTMPISSASASRRRSSPCVPSLMRTSSIGKTLFGESSRIAAGVSRGIVARDLFNEFVAPEAIEILATGIATEKGVSPINYAADLRAEKLKPPPVGRLDRWKIPKPVARVIRAFCSPPEKNYPVQSVQPILSKQVKAEKPAKGLNNMDRSTPDLVVFLHIPKSAGTTVHQSKTRSSAPKRFSP